MRLWHKDLIHVLPREQLVAQWRECSAIAGAIIKNGTPNHLLVNFVNEYSYDHFISYSYYIRKEMNKRGYRTIDSVWQKIVSLKPDYMLIDFQDIYSAKMNDMYKIICYYNLYEKYTCGGMPYDEIFAITKEMSNLLCIKKENL